MKKNLIAMGFGLVGMVLAIIAFHIYSDHIIFHNILNQIVAQQQQRQNAQEPNPSK